MIPATCVQARIHACCQGELERQNAK